MPVHRIGQGFAYRAEARSVVLLIGNPIPQQPLEDL
jgi:hypothetical protein